MSESTVTELVRFQPSPIHGLGGFARADIPSGRRIIEYFGERITKSESRRRCELNNQYIFALDEEQDLDGNVPENLARFFNHSCVANSEARLEEGSIWLVALREIRAGEEITFDYGYDLESFREHPCRCGASNCVGYIVGAEHFEYVLQRRAMTGCGMPADNPIERSSQSLIDERA